MTKIFNKLIKILFSLTMIFSLIFSTSGVTSIKAEDTRADTETRIASGSVQGAIYGSKPMVTVKYYSNDGKISSGGEIVPNGAVYYYDQACTQKIDDITKVDVGTYYVRGEFPGNDNYKPSVSDPVAISITQGFFIFSYTNTSITKCKTDIGTKFTNDTLSPTPTTNVTYSTSNDSVASVDTTTGEVTIKGVGQATISVTVASSTNYLAFGSPTYRVTVNEDHNYEHHDLKPATKSESGLKEHYTCSICGKYFDVNKNETALENLVIEQLSDTPAAKALVANDALEGLSEELKEQATQESYISIKTVSDNIVTKKLSVDGIDIDSGNISEVKVSLNVVKDDNVDSSISNSVTSYINSDDSIDSYYDVTMKASVVNANGEVEAEKDLKEIGNTSVPVTLSLAHIANLYNLFVKVVHFHTDSNGNQTLEYLPAKVDKANEIVTVYMNKFSTLALVTSTTTDVDYISDGNVYKTYTVSYNEKLTQPSNPSKNGYTFGGWYSDEAYATAYDFSQGVTDSLTLYAKWNKNNTSSSSSSSSQSHHVTCEEYMNSNNWTWSEATQSCVIKAKVSDGYVVPNTAVK